MHRRDFIAATAGAIVGGTLVSGVRGASSLVAIADSPQLDAAAFHASRRFASTVYGRIAYVERGRGPAALFVHGYPLNGFQWRGALDRLHPHRRCVAPDLMGMGFTHARGGQTISPSTQAAMLVAVLESLRIDAVDLVANDSGGAVAQVFVAKYPQRVRSLLLTNCDVDENSPPPQFLPFIEMAKRGMFVDEFIIPQLNDKELARSAKGMGGLAYTYPARLEDETIETYFRPIVETPLKKAQMEQYAISMETNLLVAIREELRCWRGPARMVWGLKDTLFGVQWAEWLDRTLPGSRGVRRVEGANLFFPEEMPDLIAEEAAKLWGVQG
jgi:pimeloyl-ACP methyl ester carboxylesterase